MSELGERVKQCRKELGFSQKDLGKLVSMTQQNIAKIEKGAAKGTYSFVPLAKALLVNTEWLMTGEGPKRPSTGDAEADNLIAEEPAVYAAASTLFDKLSALSPEQLRAIEALVDSFSSD